DGNKQETSCFPCKIRYYLLYLAYEAEFMNSDRLANIKERLAQVLQRNGVKKAALFGSIARGEATAESDIDILVEFEGNKSLLDLAGLKIEIEETLGKSADVLTYDSLNPLLKERILKEQVVIF
ncbi:MAG TPA: nucleotidyltransferase family protein, partial [Thermodesulfobacteriota bacterium]|nr:nucleotidyltransferase family protein [Thermodesulfobacteriota bacterium]